MCRPTGERFRRDFFSTGRVGFADSLITGRDWGRTKEFDGSKHRLEATQLRSAVGGDGGNLLEIPVDEGIGVNGKLSNGTEDSDATGAAKTTVDDDLEEGVPAETVRTVDPAIGDAETTSVGNILAAGWAIAEHMTGGFQVRVKRAFHM